MSEVDAIGAVRVWILPPAVVGNQYAFPWSLNFVEELRLIPERSSKRPGGMGSATFRLLRAQRDDGQGDGLVSDPGNVVAGAYIAITAGVDTFSAGAVQWWGYISTVNITRVRGVNDGLGTVEAMGLGSLLDGVQLTGWRQDDGLGGSVAIESPPTWNLSEAGGKIVGNTVDVGGVPVFAKRTTDCSATAYGSRLGLLEHVLAFCVPPSMPTLNLSAGVVGAYLDDTGLPEVLDVRCQTLKGALDSTIARSRGFGWDVVPADASSWTIVAYPLLGAGDGPVDDEDYPTAPSPTPVDLADVACESFDVVHDGSDLYDAVTIEGEPIVHCGLIGYRCNNADRGWTAAQETAYRAGVADTGEAPSVRKEKTRQLRESGSLADVFTRYTLIESASGNIYAGTLTGAEPDAGTTPFFPSVEWDGTTATVNSAIGYDPHMPSTRIMRNIPWPEGVKADGADERIEDAKIKPTYMPPRVFRYNSGDTTLGGPTWQDIARPFKSGSHTRPGASVGVDDRLPALQVRFSPPEYLAKGHWNETTDAPAEINPTVNPRAIDWQDLVATVAMEGGQRVRVRKVRPGLLESAVRRELIIRQQNLHCWVVSPDAVLGIDDDGNPETPGDYEIVRNDWPTAEKLATMGAAWAFRSRTSVRLTLARPDAPPAWASIGTMLSTITDGRASVEANTIVEDVTCDWSISRPRITITTTLPERPAQIRGLGTSSPTLGGPVSLSLGGTVAQAAQSLRGDMAALKGQLQRLPLLPPQTPASTVTIPLDVRQVAHGFTEGKAVRQSGGTWSLADDSNGSGIGVVEHVYDANAFRVVVAGLITRSSDAYTAGSTYYLTTPAGTLTATQPPPPYDFRPVLYAISAREAVVIGPVRSGAQTLAGLADIESWTPSDGDVIAWDAGAIPPQWVNGPLAAVPLRQFSQTRATVTATSGTHTFGAGKQYFIAVLIGGGGGGSGGSTGLSGTTGSFAGDGGGGGEQVYIFGRIVDPSMSFVVGGGGSGGSVSGGLGTAGDNTTLNAGSYVAAGGSAGGSGSGAGGSGPSSDDFLNTVIVRIPGENGKHGRVRAITYAAGAISGYTTARGLGGNFGRSSGAGGGGGASGSAGSAGAAGALWIWEA